MGESMRGDQEFPPGYEATRKRLFEIIGPPKEPLGIRPTHLQKYEAAQKRLSALIRGRQKAGRGSATRSLGRAEFLDRLCEAVARDAAADYK